MSARIRGATVRHGWPGQKRSVPRSSRPLTPGHAALCPRPPEADFSYLRGYICRTAREGRSPTPGSLQHPWPAGVVPSQLLDAELGDAAVVRIVGMVNE